MAYLNSYIFKINLYYSEYHNFKQWKYFQNYTMSLKVLLKENNSFIDTL